MLLCVRACTRASSGFCVRFEAKRSIAIYHLGQCQQETVIKPTVAMLTLCSSSPSLSSCPPRIRYPPYLHFVHFLLPFSTVLCCTGSLSLLLIRCSAVHFAVSYSTPILLSFSLSHLLHLSRRFPFVPLFLLFLLFHLRPPLSLSPFSNITSRPAPSPLFRLSAHVY